MSCKCPCVPGAPPLALAETPVVLFPVILGILLFFFNLLHLLSLFLKEEQRWSHPRALPPSPVTCGWGWTGRIQARQW